MVVLLVAAGCALISAGTAQAHSALVGSTPSADAVLDTAPSSVELVFNQEIQTSFANVTVSAADGTQVGAGEPSVQGERVSLVTSGQMSSGTYTVGYRVISEDGHPITGSYSFTLNAATNNAAPLPGGATPPATVAPSAATADADSDDGSPLLLPILGGAVAILFVIGMVIVLRGDKRSKR
ncbi:copper resistance protein CopC [Rhodococcus sp. ARC_M8]|uniref:copper resistance CopC family protein n=1 Tax=Rhodococcus TaxID=1827 RepID=UPI001F12F7D7|nr:MULTISPECIES: copper resistance CopC family protein [Rhodococcus]MCJ0950308.1 copper resistance protein CopC [Rhodococcus sp. ARC_M8]MDJ0441153.1 copper resistance protein CopC [Rhodococcus qingshengii]ULD44953.1 copper resistance protein CopC [Rhodococcus qingshengii]